MNVSFDLSKYIDEETTLCWLRRDLRLDDNAALYYTLKENIDVQLIFIFDSNILNDLEHKTDKRIQFIHESLSHLNEELKQGGASLLILYGDPAEIFGSLKPKAVYTNHDYESYAKTRDDSIGKTLATKGTTFKTFKDQVIFEKDEILKADGTPYTVFTPYSKKWKAKLNSFYVKSYPVRKYLGSLKRSHNIPFPSLEEIGFTKGDIEFPSRTIRQSVIANYDKTRNFPGIKGTTRLSVHLRFGTVSIRKLVTLAEKKNDVWLNELIWREFYMMILWYFPHVETRSLAPPPAT
jgi:deoxyribodipyrimidine photo-lyase